MIGIFDSGFGGLSVFREIENVLPEHDLLYLGDTQRQPYGNRSQETIIDWTREAVEFLFKSGCELIIIACHTASSQALRPIQQKYLPFSPFAEKRVLGVTIPLVESVCEIAGKRVGVLGTKGTCRSQSFTIEIHKRRPELEVFTYPAPLLIPFVEEGYHKTPECRRLVKKYLVPLKQQQVDTLILGCTHFPLLLDVFREKMSKRTIIPDPSKIAAEKLLDYLKRHPEIDSRISRHKKRSFLTTDDPESFAETGSRFLGRKFIPLKVQYS
jgi:glutamate racemase